MVIYQLLVRLFSNRNTKPVLNGTIAENGTGKFNEITSKALEELKALGITHIWYTGILEHATMSDFTAFNIQPDDWRLVKGRAGSPFAIKDYFDVSPELAVDVANRMTEFEELIKRTHAMEMKAIIEFIPNHVARGYHTECVEGKMNFFGSEDDINKDFDPQNNFYYLNNTTFSPPADYFPLGIEDIPAHSKTHVEWPAKVTGNNVLSAAPSTNDWFETVKLNFGVNIFNGNTKYFDPIPKTWIYFREILFYWAGKGVDGFRCDMAEMVPVEFWSWIIPQVKAVYKDVFFIGEIYQPEQYADYIYSGRFDYLYDKAGLYDKLVAVVKEEVNADEIYSPVSNTISFSDHMLYFLENHDEVRIASQKFAKNPWAGIPAMALLSTISKGPVMIYFGQEVGETADIPAGFGGGNGRTTIYDYWNAPEHQKWMNNGSFDGGQLSNSQKTLRNYYQKLLTLLNSQEAITDGNMLYADADIKAMEDTTANSKYIFAFYRFTTKQRLLIIVNFSRTHYFKVGFNIDLDKWYSMYGSLTATYEFKELLSGAILSANSSGNDKLLSNELEIVIPPSGAQVYLINEVI